MPRSSTIDLPEPSSKATQPVNRRPIYVVLLALSVLTMVAIYAKSYGLVFNVTHSMPDRFYTLGRGEKYSMASFCSPIPYPPLARGPCPDGSLPLIKRVVGVAGDHISVTDDGIQINERPVPHSKPLDVNTKGSALPHLRGSFTLQPGEIWVAGEHPHSFDSRYFGPVKLPKVL